MTLAILGLVLLLGQAIYQRRAYRAGRLDRCPHCGRYYRGNLTYGPHCSEIVAKWSGRR